MRIERLPVSAPILLARLELRQFPGRLTDIRSRRGRSGKALNEFFANETMLRVGLPVDIEGEMDERAKSLLARSEIILCPAFAL